MATIQHIAILSKDNEALAEFYTKTFGMREAFRQTSEHYPGMVAIYLTDGHINLALLPAVGDLPEGLNHFGFKVDEVDATRTVGLSLGAKVGDELPRDGRFAEEYIIDPSGTRVDMAEKGWDIGEGLPE